MKKSEYKHLKDSYNGKTDFYEAPDGMPFLRIEDAEAYTKENKLDVGDIKTIASEDDCEKETSKSIPVKTAAGTEAVSKPTTSKATAGKKQSSTEDVQNSEKEGAVNGDNAVEAAQ